MKDLSQIADVDRLGKDALIPGSVELPAEDALAAADDKKSKKAKKAEGEPSFMKDDPADALLSVQIAHGSYQSDKMYESGAKLSVEAKEAKRLVALGVAKLVS